MGRIKNIGIVSVLMFCLSCTSVVKLDGRYALAKKEKFPGTDYFLFDNDSNNYVYSIEHYNYSKKSIGKFQYFGERKVKLTPTIDVNRLPLKISQKSVAYTKAVTIDVKVSDFYRDTTIFEYLITDGKSNKKFNPFKVDTVFLNSTKGLLIKVKKIKNVLVTEEDLNTKSLPLNFINDEIKTISFDISPEKLNEISLELQNDYFSYINIDSSNNAIIMKNKKAFIFHHCRYKKK